jgi:hypothetical protein
VLEHLSSAATTGSSNFFTVHLWHIVEAVGFLMTSLGGIAVAEFIQGRQGRVSVGPGLGGPSSSSIALSRRAGAAPVADEPAGRPEFLLPLVALAGAAAAGVHYVVMPTHFAESWMYGTFFLVAATSQVGYSIWLLARPSRALLTAGAVGNITIALLWLYTRTAGIPLGPASGETESFGALDTLASAFELVGAVASFALLRRAVLRPAVLRPTKPSQWSRAVWFLAAAVGIGIAVTAYLWPAS